VSVSDTLGRRWLEGLVPDLARHLGALTHDELDAVLAAYTALLRERGLTGDVGDPTEGQVCLPLALSPVVGQ
jgi:predicted nuclease with RNAse H fold